MCRKVSEVLKKYIKKDIVESTEEESGVVQFKLRGSTLCAMSSQAEVTADEVEGFLKKNAGGQLGQDVVEDVQLFDIYKGKPIPKGRVSLAFAIFYRSRERTLTDEEVGPAFEAVLEKVKSEFGVEIRS